MWLGVTNYIFCTAMWIKCFSDIDLAKMNHDFKSFVLYCLVFFPLKLQNSEDTFTIFLQFGSDVEVN